MNGGQGPEPPTGHLHRILVIDDDDGVRKFVSRVLEEEGFEPVGAINGRAGVELFTRGRFALVITDLMMLEEDGIEVIGEIRTIDPRVPILAVSGAGTEHYSPLADAQELGADRVLMKPLSAEVLLGVVDELMAWADNRDAEGIAP